MNQNEKVITAEEWYCRGIVKAYKRDYSGAISDYTRAIEIDPDYALAKRNLELAEELQQLEKE